MGKLTATLPLRAESGLLAHMPGSFGIEREDWHVEARRAGSEVVVHMTARHPRRAVERLARSDDPVDRWFKEQLQVLTGEDVAGAFLVTVMH